MFPITLPQKRQTAVVLLMACLCHYPDTVFAHEFEGHQGPTYEVAPAVGRLDVGPSLKLSILDDDSGEPTAARFTLLVDGETYIPDALGQHGLLFTSIHVGKKQRYSVTYARGTGPVEIPLPKGANAGKVFVVKGYDYLPVKVAFDVSGEIVERDVRLRRWNGLVKDGWMAADEHLHYDRLDPAQDGDWLTMLAADGLAHAHFLVLKGGNLPGVWARQFAYGAEGTAKSGDSWIRPGEEYRDSSLGHINLLGVDAVIEPISTGGMGEGGPRENSPPLSAVLSQARELGGMGGPAHGATLGKSPTGVLDAILGCADFFEIANTHLCELDAWYSLLNCGIVLPPAAGTDLPNNPYRDPWQPFLGESRMYVQLEGGRDFESWKQAVRAGKVFITSGPMIQLSVNAQSGETVDGVLRLEKPGVVRIQAELRSPEALEEFEIVLNGRPLQGEIQKSVSEEGVHQWRIDHALTVQESCWIAARGRGQVKAALRENIRINQHAIAHTAAARVLVDGRPIGTQAAVAGLAAQLREQRWYYAEKGVFSDDAQRDALLHGFDQGMSVLKERARVLDGN